MMKSKILSALAACFFLAATGQAETTFHLFKSANPMPGGQVGDLYYTSSVSGLNGTVAPLHPGSNGKCLVMTSGLPAWVTCPGGGGGSTSPLTTKGDLWGFDSADNRVPIGSDGKLLVADSGAALGLSWRLLLAADIPAIPESGVTSLVSDLAGKVSLQASTPGSADTGHINVTGTVIAGAFSGPLTGAVTGNASTATALAANGGNCSAGEFAQGVDASGAAEGCTALPSGSGTINFLPYWTSSSALGASAISYDTLAGHFGIGVGLVADPNIAISLFDSVNSPQLDVKGDTGGINNGGAIRIWSSGTGGRKWQLLGSNGGLSPVGSFAIYDETGSIYPFQIGTTGQVKLGAAGLLFPNADGSTGQCMKTNGSLALSFSNCLATSGTAGGVLFSDGTAVTEDATKFFWDDTKKYLGIGTASPAQPIHSSWSVDSAVAAPFNAARFDLTRTGSTADGKTWGAFVVNLTDSATVGASTFNGLRFIFTKSAGSADSSAGSDTSILVHHTIAESLTEDVRFMTFEGPNVATGKTLDRSTGLYIPNHSGAGAVTHPRGIITESEIKNGFGTASPAATVDISGIFAIENASLTLSNGLNSDIALPASSRVRVSGPTGAFSIGGFASPVNGAKMELYVTVAQTVTVVNEDASSTAANRIKTLAGANVAYVGPAIIDLEYDTTDVRWVLHKFIAVSSGGGGGGATVTSGTEASRPAAGNMGNVFISTDGWTTEYDNGSTWDRFYSGLKVTDPPTGSFAWRNQGAASVNTTYGGEELVDPYTNGYQLRGREIAIPGGSWAIEASGVAGCGWAYQFCAWGLYVSDGTKLITFGLPHEYQNIWRIKWTNVTTQSSAPNNTPIWQVLTGSGGATLPLILQIRDDATTFFWEFSLDGGVTFNTLYSEPRTTFLTATKVGYFVYANNATLATAGKSLHFRLEHWRQK